MSEEPLYCLKCGTEVPECDCEGGRPDDTAPEEVRFCHLCGAPSTSTVCKPCTEAIS